jgi:hypothetical protein
VNEQHNTQMLPMNHAGKPVPPLDPSMVAIRNPGSFKEAAFSPPSRKRFPCAQEPSGADTIVSGTHVNAPRLRSWAATALSSWLGFYADSFRFAL